MASDDANWGKHLGRGFEVAIGVFLGYIAGNWFDKKFSTAPWGLYVAVMLGCAAGMYSLIREAVRDNRDDGPKK